MYAASEPSLSESTHRMPAARRRLTAWIALAAMLFGAVSPALAGVLFAGRADVLCRMLAIPVAATAPAAQETAAADDDGCPHEASGPVAGEGHDTHHGGHDSQDGSEHAAHGVFCAFCLTAGSTVTLPAPTAIVWTVTPVDLVVLPAAQETPPAVLYLSTRHPRDPPAVLS